MFDLFFTFSAFFLRTERGGGGVVGSREEKIVADKVNCLPKLQGRTSPYKFLVPCLSVRVKFTNQ